MERSLESCDLRGHSEAVWRLLVLRGDGCEGAAVVAAVEELDGELEVLLALLRVGVQAHRPLLAELRKKSGKGSENSFFRYCDVQGSAKVWSLGCVISASWPLLAVGGVSRNLGNIL